jgi:plasmid replication initiation protein
MTEEEEVSPLRELKPDKNFPVVKANKLIESSYKLSLQEQRIVLSLISKIRKEDRDFQWYKVRISNLAKFLGIDKNKNVRKELRENIRALMRKIITIKGPDKDTDLHWIDAADYGVKGYVKICVHKELKPYLLGLKSHFTRYCLKYVIDFKSSYSIRFYEILKRFEHNEKVTLELEKFKYMLGFKDDEYELYGHFKNKVLLVAQREISEKTDISFAFEEVGVIPTFVQWGVIWRSINAWVLRLFKRANIGMHLSVISLPY